MAMKKILIADDDVQMVSALRTLLENVGFAVAVTHHSKEVLELSRRERPDLILLDVLFAGMPGPDGFEVSRKIAKDKELRTTPVIILSGVKRVISSDFKVEPDEEWLPVAAFLDKPVRPDELLKEIERLLSDRSHA